MTSRPRPDWTFVAAAVLLLVQLGAYRDYFTDDSYIYARFAEHLVGGHGLVFNPGEAVHAATSPLWAILLAGLLAAGMSAVAGAKLLGGACAVGALLVARRIARRRFGPRWLAAGFVFALATQPWFVRWSASGMETPLAVLLVLLAIEAGMRPAREVAFGRLGWSVGLLPLVRPEGVLLLVLGAALGLRDPVVRRRVGFWAGALLPLAVWAAFAWPVYGAVFPATLQAKSTPLGLVPSRFLANLVVLAKILAVALAIPAAAWAASLLRGPARLVRAAPGDWFAPVLWSWTVVLPAVYLVRDVQVVSRYLELLTPAILVLGISALVAWRGVRVTAGLIAVQAVVGLGLGIGWVAPSANRFGRDLDGLVAMGEWLRENTDPDAVVAAYDIGAIGYASKREVLDLGGLVHPGINDLRDRVDDARILHEGLFLDHGDPDFLVDRDPDGAVLAGRALRGRICEPVLETTVANLGLTRPQPVVYTLYRLTTPH